jgi:hypothetical protein
VRVREFVFGAAGCCGFFGFFGFRRLFPGIFGCSGVFVFGAVVRGVAGGGDFAGFVEPGGRGPGRVRDAGPAG